MTDQEKHIYKEIQSAMAKFKELGQHDWFDRLSRLQGRIGEAISERDGKIRAAEWKTYRQLEEGEMTQVGDDCLGPDENDKWTPVEEGSERYTPPPYYPAHCRYRRHIAKELIGALDSIYELWDRGTGHLTTHYGHLVTNKMKAYRVTLEKAKKSLDL